MFTRFSIHGVPSSSGNFNLRGQMSALTKQPLSSRTITMASADLLSPAALLGPGRVKSRRTRHTLSYEEKHKIVLKSESGSRQVDLASKF